VLKKEGRLRTYQELRETYLKKKDHLSVELVESIIKELLKLKETSSRIEVESIEDLIDDLEILLETRDVVKTRKKQMKISSIAPSQDVYIEIMNEKSDRLMSEVEFEVIRQALSLTKGSRIQTAKILGIAVRTLRSKLRSYIKNGRVKSA